MTKTVSGWIRVGAERHLALQSFDGSRDDENAALVFGFPAASATPELLAKLGGGESLGPVPLLVRSLRVVPPLARGRRAAVREIAIHDPRLTRLWERFCIDVGVAVERNAAFITRRIFDRPERGYRCLIVEDGDRYAIRAVCIFAVKEENGGRTGYILELLHDRSVDGMRGASHLLGLAVREASEAGATALRAWSLPHSGSFPIYALHAFLPVPARFRPSDPQFCVHAVDEGLADVVTRRERWYLSYLDDDTI